MSGDRAGARTPVPRVVLHLDMDAFYAAVEIRENPALAGRPLIIGHRGPRGVVSTCSYEARRYGVRSALPSVIAERRCPEAIWLPGRMPLYVEVSRAIRRILDDFSPVVEPLSIDEAFVDLGGLVADLDAGRAIARAIKARIRDEQRLTGSVGLAPNKFLAKLASDLEKPDGLVVLDHQTLPERLWPLPVSRLWGVGPSMERRLGRGGLRTVGDLVRVPAAELGALVGTAAAAHLQALAAGQDDRPVEPHRRAKSISEERTYARDLTDPDAIDRALLARAEGVARQLRRQRLAGRTVQLKLRTGDFTTWTRSLTLDRPTDLAEPILAAARLLRERVPLARRGVRLLGVGVSALEPAGLGQGRLFADPDERRARRLARAADSVRERLGEHAVTRARLLRPGRRRGPQPDAEASSPPAVD